jgi:hypothetical protein
MKGKELRETVGLIAVVAGLVENWKGSFLGFWLIT